MIGSSGSSRADQRARDFGAAAALAETEERPGAFAKALDQAGLGQQPQMPRQPRLRLAQDFGEVGHRQFGLGQQRQDAQPRRLAGGFERGGQAGEAQKLIVHGHSRLAGTVCQASTSI